MNKEEAIKERDSIREAITVHGSLNAKWRHKNGEKSVLVVDEAIYDRLTFLNEIIDEETV